MTRTVVSRTVVVGKSVPSPVVSGVVRAQLTIRDAAQLTAAERKAVASWLKRLARFIQKDGDLFASRFKSRYYEAT